MRSLAILVVAFATLAVQADILHLRDGTRYYGELISQSDQAVVFRIILADGTSGATRTFSADQVKRVERTTRNRPDPKREYAPSEPGADYEQMLREAFELIADADLHAALRAMQHAVNAAPPAGLEQLDHQTRKARGLPLAELMAETRLQIAVQPRDGTAFKLTHVPRFEAPAFGALLEERHETLLAKQYRQRSIAEWVADRAAYDELGPDTRPMMKDAQLAAAMMFARLKHDPRLREDRERRRQLQVSHAELARFISRVISMRGYTTLSAQDDPSDPAALEARRMQKQQALTSQPTTTTKEAP